MRQTVKCDKGNRFSTTYHQTFNPQELFGKYPIQRMAIVMAIPGTLRSYFNAFGDLDWGSVTGTCFKSILKIISKIPTITPSLFSQNMWEIEHGLCACTER